jgi:glycosyltransferase involved in cell wall biosynthesis
MRRALVLAYYFPPAGGGGVQRSVKFVKYLPLFGYAPVVVTGPAVAAGGVASPWAPTDETLSTEVGDEPDIARIDVAEPPPSGRWRRRAERWLGAPRPFSRWWIEESVALGARVGRDAELIYASMSPFESGVAAARLARELGKPWVADLRDPWALDEILVYPTFLHRRLEAARMRRTLASAAAIVMNTPEAAAAVLRAFPELRVKRIITIPNGYDAEDFTGPPPDRDGTFRIVHAGFAHTARIARAPSRLLGGAVRGFNVLTRSHVTLLQATERLLARRPDLRNGVEVHLAGFTYDEERDRLNSEYIHLHGYLPHRETVALLRSSDLLFLPMHDLPAGRRALTVPGKTYEYVASGRPILAAVPKGDAADLLSRCGTATVCRPSDLAAIERALEEAIERHRDGRPAPPLDRGVIEPFERRALTQRLAEVFDAAIEGREAEDERRFAELTAA